MPFTISYWSMFGLWCCVTFCYTTKGISHLCTCIPSLWDISLSHPIGHHRPPCAVQQLPTCLTHRSVQILLFQLAPPSPSLPRRPPHICSLHLHLYACPAHRLYSLLIWIYIVSIFHIDKQCSIRLSFLRTEALILWPPRGAGSQQLSPKFLSGLPSGEESFLPLYAWAIQY